MSHEVHNHQTMYDMIPRNRAGVRTPRRLSAASLVLFDIKDEYWMREAPTGLLFQSEQPVKKITQEKLFMGLSRLLLTL